MASAVASHRWPMPCERDNVCARGLSNNNNSRCRGIGVFRRRKTDLLERRASQVTRFFVLREINAYMNENRYIGVA